MSSRQESEDLDEYDNFIHAPPVGTQDYDASSSASEYDRNKLNLIPSTETEIDVHRDGINGDRHLLSTSDNTTLYFSHSSVFRPGTPDVTVFAGSDKTGAVVGVCRFVAFSTSILVGRSDAANPSHVEWEELSKTSRDHSSYKFSVGSQMQERKSYTWKRTHDKSLKGPKASKLDRRSWKLEDDVTGQVVAVFASIKGRKEVGKFRLLASKGKEWEEWVLLTCLGLSEKARRRAMARRDLSWFC